MRQICDNCAGQGYTDSGHTACGVCYGAGWYFSEGLRNPLAGTLHLDLVDARATIAKLEAEKAELKAALENTGINTMNCTVTNLSNDQIKEIIEAERAKFKGQLP